MIPFLLLLAAVTADTTPYVVLNHGRPAGTMTVVHTGDSVIVRYLYVDRNRGQRVEMRYHLAGADAVLGYEMRAVEVDGSPGAPMSRYDIVGDSGHLTLTVGGRGGRGGGAPRTLAAPSDTSLFPNSRPTPFDEALMARFLLRHPQHRGHLFPRGTARADVVADTSVTTALGRQHLRLVMVDVGGPAPSGVWLDDRDELFASDVAWFITVRRGGESALPALRAVEVRWRNARGEALAKRLTKPVAQPLVIRNGDLFDSEHAVVRPRMTVVVHNDRIVAVGPADSVPVPAGATVIDATGKTVMPGMWDVHGHFQLTSQTAGSVRQLATGITTIRDLASDIDVAVSQRDRANAGRLISPRVILAGFIEGPGAWAGPSRVLVRTEDEAREWVARYDSLGYRQIKLYNLVHPDLVPTIAAEAHRRGMRLSGHIPRGLSVPAAVELGYDEIQHAAFLFSTFYEDSLFVPTMRAYSLVANIVASNVDVDGPPMTNLIEFLRQHHTVIDGTFNIWQNGELTGQGNAGTRNYGRLLKRLYDAGVTIVPGTDNNSGATYVTELQLYQHDGIPAPEVLRIATLVPAQVMGDDHDYGSIAVGKVADILVVNGRPYEQVADLRKLDRVIRAGRVYDPRDILAALQHTP